MLPTLRVFPRLTPLHLTTVVLIASTTNSSLRVNSAQAMTFLPRIAPIAEHLCSVTVTTSPLKPSWASRVTRALILTLTSQVNISQEPTNILKLFSVTATFSRRVQLLPLRTKLLSVTLKNTLMKEEFQSAEQKKADLPRAAQA